MSRIWCSEKDCYYNRRDCVCGCRNVFVHDGECISCRYDRPKDKRESRDVEEVRRDRHAKKVADKIRASMMGESRKHE